MNPRREPWLAHRPDIDGLRALAVLAILFFHAGFDGFDGGHVGVDMFFVISGYLITGNIVTLQAENAFRLSSFYERRARRILPALIVTMLLCVPLAWVLLAPREMKAFAASLVATSLFASNVYFWQSLRYFDVASERHPLVHTWSLGVEEQFYLLYPLLLWGMSRWSGNARTLVLAAVAASSLALACWASVDHASAAFYLLPTRVWELLTGALVMLATRRSGMPLPPGLRPFLAWTGLAMLPLAMVVNGPDVPVPGPFTVLPVLGTALVIAFGGEGGVARLLSVPPLVRIGLISYSAYLIHQPLLAFARAWSPEPLTGAQGAVLVVLTLVLAQLSWAWVEMPCRAPERLGRRSFLVWSGVGLAFLVSFGAAGWLAGGYEARYTGPQRTILANLDFDYRGPYRWGTCFVDTMRSPPSDTFSGCILDPGPGGVPARVVFGDSYAAALALGFRSRGEQVSQFAVSGCSPVLHEVVAQGPRRCRALVDLALERVVSARPTQIFLHANWLFYRDQELQLGVAALLARLRVALPTTEVVLVGTVPHWYPSLPAAMLRHATPDAPDARLPAASWARADALDRSLAASATAHGARFVAPRKLFCTTDGSCRATMAHRGAVALTAWDDGHLTEAGAAWLADEVMRTSR